MVAVVVVITVVAVTTNGRRGSSPRCRCHYDGPLLLPVFSSSLLLNQPKSQSGRRGGIDEVDELVVVDEGLIEVVLDVESWTNWMRSVGRGQHPIKLKQISLTEELEDDELEATKLESEETCGKGVGKGEGLGDGVEDVLQTGQYVAESGPSEETASTTAPKKVPDVACRLHLCVERGLRCCADCDSLQRGKVEVKRGVVTWACLFSLVKHPPLLTSLEPLPTWAPSYATAPPRPAPRAPTRAASDDSEATMATVIMQCGIMTPRHFRPSGPSCADAAPMVTVTVTVVSYNTSTSTSAAPDSTSLAPAEGPASSTPTSITMIDITSPSSDTRDRDRGQPPLGDMSAYGKHNPLLPIQGLPFPWPI
ncbi:hypothetical protein EDB83DRAFT_2585411 [Lactarius deliciosus]|nr:hypothetical protein EDB83DRAFT_2585411 [Lactarius deliciosus]